MSTCELLPTAKMTDDHFMNPCILIRTDAASSSRMRNRSRSRSMNRSRMKDQNETRISSSLGRRQKTMPSLVSSIPESQHPVQHLILSHSHQHTLSLALSGSVLLDNDGSAFCKCKIYFAMYKLNVRHINNFVQRQAWTNASTMHSHTHTLIHSHSHSHSHIQTLTHTHKLTATAIKLRPSLLLCITF